MASPDPQQTQSVFEVLRPICVRLMKEPTLLDVQVLHGMLASVPSSVLQQLQQYILFPLRLIVKEPQKRSQELCEHTVACMCAVIKQTSVTDWDMFSDLFSVLSVLISCRSNVGKVAEISEELKLAVVQCLIAIVQSADKRIKSCIYQPTFLPALGHLVSILLSAAHHEKLRELKIQSMECLLQLAQCSGEGWQKNAHANDARVAFASFLPGISITICSVILGDSKQGQDILHRFLAMQFVFCLHQTDFEPNNDFMTRGSFRIVNVTVKAIDLWAKLVSLVMSENPINQSEELPTNQSPKLSASAPNGESLLVKRTKEWVESTARKLDILIGRIVTMATNPYWKVRVALVKFARVLLFECKSSLKESTPMLLELLVRLVGDDYSQVASLSQDTLKKISQNVLDGEAKQLVELLEDNLYSLMTVLPRLVRASDDSKKLSTLNLVIGYLELLGPRITSLLHSAAHMKRLSLALIQVVEFDTREVKILEDVKLNPDGSSRLEEFQYFKTRRKYFKHFTDDTIYQAFVKICHLLGKYGNITLLVDHFLDLFHNASIHRNQTVLILNELMLGTLGTGMSDNTVASLDIEITGLATPCAHDAAEIECAIRLLMQEYLSDENWHLPTSFDQSETAPSTQPSSNWLVTTRQQKESFSLATINSNAMLICLLLEGIGAFAQVLGASFNLVIMDCLYPILEKLADEKAIISQSAYNTLADICTSSGYSCIPDLLCTNADYLVNAISLKLRHFEFNPKAPSVLKVTLQHSNTTMLPLLEDTINEILSSLDQYYGEKAAAFMKVLHALVTSIVRWFPAEKKIRSSCFPESLSSESSPEGRSLDSKPVDDVMSFFLEYHHLKKIADGQVEDVEDVDCGPSECADVEEEEEGEDVDKRKELPMHVQAVKQVLERCLHFVSSKDPRLRLLVLDVIQHGILVLASNEDELLPLVHKLWPGFIQRFTDSEILVTCKACDTLYVMGDNCGDFVRKRVIKDVWPKLIGFLKSQAKISVKSGPAYRHTSAYKLQNVILGGIGRLCQQIDLGESELSSMLSACLPYLSAKQPETLQQAAVEMVQAVMQLEPDSVWLTLSDLYCPKPLEPPHQVFPIVKFAGRSLDENEYSTNVDIILNGIKTP